MIEVKIQADEKDISYPILKSYNTDSRFIVLFTKLNCGIVVDPKCSRYEIGDTSKAWNERDYTTISDSVVLTNKED